jgi:hypothetical protein
MNLFGDTRLKYERMKDLPILKQEIISHVFDLVVKKGTTDQWGKFSGEFRFDGKDYNVECEARYNNQMFTYRNLFIEYKQVVIDVDDMVRRGMLD